MVSHCHPRPGRHGKCFRRRRLGANWSRPMMAASACRWPDNFRELMSVKWPLT